MHTKIILALALSAFLGIIPCSFVYAQTPPSNTQALIKQLQEMVASLQKQITELKVQLEATKKESVQTKEELTATKQEVQTLKEEIKFNRSLTKGAQGDDVRKVQEFLAQFPDLYPSGLITGFYGTTTETAIKRFQEKHGIETIGVAGPKTFAQINKLLTEGAGKSGIIPPGLLRAPGIQKKLATATIIATTTATTTLPEIPPPSFATTTPPAIIPPPASATTTPIATTTLSTPPPPSSFVSPSSPVPEIRITTNPADQLFPIVSGDKIVWEDYRNGGSDEADIYLYDLSANTEKRITSAKGREIYPFISGNRIVYAEVFGPNGHAIHLYDLTTNTDSIIALGTYFRPAIDGDKIVFAGWSSLTGIYLYDLSTKMLKKISTTGDAMYPSISGNYVTWYSTYGGSWKVYLYDLNTGIQKLITPPGVQQGNPRVSSGKIVLTEGPITGYASWNVYVYDISTGTEQRITTQSSSMQTDLSISGDKIVWATNYNADVYLYDLATKKETQLTNLPAEQWHSFISGNRVVWSDRRNDNFDIYTADVSAISGSSAQSTPLPAPPPPPSSTTPPPPSSVAPPPSTATTTTTTATTTSSTATSTPDTTAPVLSGIGSASVTANSAIIGWTTNELADSQIEYSATTSYGSQTTLDTNSRTDHSVSLVNLTASTMYHYRVKSKDLAGNLAISADQTFTTQTPVVAEGKQKWAYTPATTYNPPGGDNPSIGADGTIYTGNYNGLFAVNPDGTQKWTLTNTGYASPVIGNDGMLFSTTGSLTSYALNPDGSTKWTYSLSANGLSGRPALASDGTLYVINRGEPTLYAFSSTGSLKWTFATTSPARIGSPAIASDGTIYVGAYYDGTHTGTYGAVYALNPDGSVKWSFNIPKINYILSISAFAIGSDGTLYFGTSEGRLFALNPNGTQKWVYQASGITVNLSAPSIASDGTLYTPVSASGFSTKLIALNPDGTQKWAFTGSQDLTTPTIGADGTLYAGAYSYGLYAINQNGTTKWMWNGADTYGYNTPSLAPDGTIYISSQASAKVYAIKGVSLGLANSSWPRSMKNNRFTSRAGDALTFDTYSMKQLSALLLSLQKILDDFKKQSER